ncbi:MAG: TrkA C-terminal domain-containing protein [Planctomycetes bacterium]|nr:TrkA C-terminal domain-containing protein [Planctomycetota bacterium]
MLELISLSGMMLISLLVIRVGATALKMTGLSSDVARFQAKSAFSGAGFTTAESELVVDHPIRRRIISILITCGGFGVPLILATLMLAVTNADDTAVKTRRIIGLACGLAALIVASRFQLIDHYIENAIQFFLKRWGQLEIVDYQSMLEIERGYRVGSIKVRDDSWLAQGMSLRELQLAQAGILIIGVHRNGEYIGAPSAELTPQEGDELLCYGQQSEIEELSTRMQGDEGDVRSFEATRRHAERLDKESALLAEVNQRSGAFAKSGFISSIKSRSKSRAA